MAQYGRKERTYSEVLELAGILNVLERGLEVLQLHVDGRLSLLRLGNLHKSFS